MKRILLLSFMCIWLSTLCAAQSDLEPFYNAVYAMDHLDAKDYAAGVKLMIRMGKLIPAYHEESGSYTASPEDLEKGYTVFTRSISEDIYPNTIPGPADLGNSITLFGTNGEYTSAAICVLPHNDLNDISVEVSDLAGPNGKIPAENISARYAKYEYFSAGLQWVLKARYLFKGPAKGMRNAPRPFWLTLKIPAEAAPGIYRGTVLVSAGKKQTKLPVTLEITPIMLCKPHDDNIVWMWYYGGYSKNQELEKVMLDMREHGMTSFCSGNPFPFSYSNGKVSVDFSTAERVVPLLEKYGFTSWMSSYYKDQFQIMLAAGGTPWNDAHKKALKDYSKIVADMIKKQNWPKHIFMIEEPREDNELDNLRSWKDIYNALNIMTGEGLCMNVTWTGAGIADGKRKDNPALVCDYRDLFQYSFYNSANTFSPKVIDKIHSLKKPLLITSNKETRYFGVTAWQKGAAGFGSYVWCGSEYGNITVHGASESDPVSSKNGPVETISWEGIREGILFFRYLKTLEEAVSKCAKPDSSEAAAARSLLAEVRSYVFNKGVAEAVNIDSATLGRFRADKLDEFRYRAALRIIDLQKIK